MAGAPAITLDDLKKMQELQATISAFRKTLAPKIKAIEDSLTSLATLGDVMNLMEFEGKEKGVYKIMHGQIPLEVTFKVRKTSA